jgi:hypothetical protein
MALLPQQKVRLAAWAQTATKASMASLRPLRRAVESQNSARCDQLWFSSWVQSAVRSSSRIHGVRVTGRAASARRARGARQSKSFNSPATSGGFGGSGASQLGFVALGSVAAVSHIGHFSYSPFTLGGRLRAVLPNPSLKLSPNGVAHWASGAGASPQFCAAVPARHTVGATLARTLGRTNETPPHSYAVEACHRRHRKASPRLARTI